MGECGRIAAVYCVYDDDEWLRYSLASVYPAVDAVYFLVSTAPWNGAPTDNQRTLEVIRSAPDKDRKIQLHREHWRSEVEQRNYGLALLALDGFDYCFIVDADEIYDTAQLVSLFKYSATRPEVQCWHCNFVIYWKSPEYRIDPPERHHPPVLLRIGTGGFVEYRNCLSSSHDVIPAEICFCHHMSYARTDDQILRKISSFSHSHQVRPDWFNAVWKAWDTNKQLTDLCPYNPGAFERAVKVPAEVLPAVFRQPNFEFNLKTELAPQP